MIQINHIYKSKRSLIKVIKSSSLDFNDNKILIQIFTSVLLKKKIEDTVNEILSILPNATIIGAKTAEEIINGQMTEEKPIKSMIVYEKPQ